ncbi:MAG: penicillin-binding protein activator [Desulfuromonadaceae bacterium]|nr:penicillin-binding protein activator [Desulfuromonadaceae bacterium]
MKRIFLGILLGFMFLCGLVPLPVAALDNNASSAISVRRGIDLYHAGQPQQALAFFNNFIVNHYDSPLLGEAYLYLSRILLDQNDGEQALRYLRQLPASGRNATTQLLEGRALLSSGAADEGAALLLALDPSSLSAADRLQRLTALASVRVSQARDLEALYFLNQALAEAQTLRRDQLLQDAERILGQLDAPELAEATLLYQGTAIGQGALWQLADRAAATGRAEEALSRLNSLINDPTPFLHRPDAVTLWEQLSGKTWQRRTVGAVLPLTGRFGPFGNQVKRGMELALALHNAQNQPIDILFRDSAGEALRAEQAVAQLANEERVLAIAGPLTGQGAVNAARLAQHERTPLLTLSQRDGLPDIGEYVFRNALTNRQQVKALVHYAIEQGKKSFAVLAPDSPFGHKMAQLFAEEALLSNGLVIASEFYLPEATTFDREIKRLMGVDPNRHKDEISPAEKEATELADLFYPELPSVDFDALFIPDYAARIGLVAPQVVYYGIDDVQLLGINGWNSPDLTRLAGQFVEGAVFVDGFFRYSPYPFVQEFVECFYTRYNEEPQLLEALGFDAAGIILALLASPEITTRDQLRLALLQLANYPGVTGATSFTLNGDVDKVLFLLQVQNGNIVQIN